MAGAFSRIVPSSRVFSLRDRDDLSTTEVAELGKQAVITLPLRNLESYLLADDVIEALVVKEQKQALLGAALQLKKDAIAASIARQNRADDLKSAAGDIYTGLKKLLDLRRCGNSTDAFMRDTLAPLITPPMTTYQALKVAVIDQLA